MHSFSVRDTLEVSRIVLLSVRSQCVTTSFGKNEDVLLVKRVVFNVVSLVSSVDGIKSSHMELK